MNRNIHVPDRKCVPIIIFFAPDSQYEFSQESKSIVSLN